MTDTPIAEMVPKPCKCGRPPSVFKRRTLDGPYFKVTAAWVECVPCGLRAREHLTEALAVAAWNRRTPTGATP